MTYETDDDSILDHHENRDLVIGAWYSIAVKAFNAVGESDFSKPLVFIAAEVPGAPSPSMKSCSPTAIEVQWEAP